MQLIVMTLYKRPFVKTFAVAPMLDWTDRHCRFFHRQLSANALLYSEMVVADAAIHGPKERLLGFSGIEHPIALQLGGSDPQKLALAAKIGEDFGYDEINLNVGCPSDRVQSGTFGACLMQSPDIVATAVAAMKHVVSIPVTVKCRIGVDEQDTETALNDIARLSIAAGCDAFWVHARKAWLKGLSPKENRDVPPLDYGRVYRLKNKYPNVFIGINGGIASIEEATNHLHYVDGVMVGRAAYQNPAQLSHVDYVVYDETYREIDFESIIESMCIYTDAHIRAGGRLSHISKHMVGLFHGFPGARRWRQILSTDATNYDATSSVIRKAFAAVDVSGKQESKDGESEDTGSN
ncbi:tRNA dihydrouridine(20/20a) synthase DusA [Bartonella sp. HY329]|uniref:tRNA dihydrouridine(20/20a) synthase DusA n=1 Tax=unclassified Bartonella TaxID=2645622 RepID=UPI0021C5A7D2|nr:MULTISPECIES: tRNA dihydrouridine(20/20a) synthase DusA [unclassified Bartonella]UXM96377.1 tRNA dihydrouridine(20/20a) synthase DusA [Bartonella sp. HY329]UXN10702.1 tRNA dihydrouridine(20/20a) synthase DusA [Bartonella sp. HY328]